MHMVELGPLKDSLVGQPGLSGLALEARKVSQVCMLCCLFGWTLVGWKASSPACLVWRWRRAR